MPRCSSNWGSIRGGWNCPVRNDSRSISAIRFARSSHSDSIRAVVLLVRSLKLDPGGESLNRPGRARRRRCRRRGGLVMVRKRSRGHRGMDTAVRETHRSTIPSCIRLAHTLREVNTCKLEWPVRGAAPRCGSGFAMAATSAGHTIRRISNRSTASASLSPRTKGGPGPVRKNQVSSDRRTWPCTSVNRWSRPPWRYVRRV
jgi:hypothetical protein